MKWPTPAKCWSVYHLNRQHTSRTKNRVHQLRILGAAFQLQQRVFHHVQAFPAFVEEGLVELAQIDRRHLGVKPPRVQPWPAVVPDRTA